MYKVGIKTRSDRNWVMNGLEFDTEEEAREYGMALEREWTYLTEWTIIMQGAEIGADRIIPVPITRINTGKSWVTEP